MRYYLNDRDRKAILISNLVNSILLCFIGLIVIQPENPIIFIISTFFGSFIFQYYVFGLPTFIIDNFMNSLHPYDKVEELEQKIKEIENEIKDLKN